MCDSRCRRNHSSLRLRRIESDAKHRCRNNCCRRNHSSLRLRRIESDAEHRCRNNCCRRNHSPLASIRKSGLEIKNQCTKEGVNGEKHTSIPKSGLEIKNRCMKEGVNGEKLASIRKSGSEIKNRCRKQPISSTYPSTYPSTRSSRVDDASCLGCFTWGRARAGTAVAAKAGADAPGGGISLCFCRRGCAAPAQNAATLNGQFRKQKTGPR